MYYKSSSGSKVKVTAWRNDDENYRVAQKK